MMPRLELDADEAVQDVLNAWGANRTSPEPHPLNPDFSALFEKMMAYRNAKTVADNRRAHNRLATEEATQEQVTKKAFMDAYRAFYSKYVGLTYSSESRQDGADKRRP
jgi:hypothetical protein